MPPSPHHVQLHEEPVLGHVRVECDGHRDLDVGAQLQSNANLEKQFKLSVRSGIEDMVWNPVRPVRTVHFDNPTDRLAGSPTGLRSSSK